VHTLWLVDQTVWLDQLYSYAVIMLSSLCTPVRHFVVTSAHTLLGPVCNLTLPKHICGAHIVFGSVVHSGNVYTTAVYNCTLASASLSTNQRRASIYLICSFRRPSAVLKVTCWQSPSALQNGRLKNKICIVKLKVWQCFFHKLC
jgi:hypothetical protein